VVSKSDGQPKFVTPLRWLIRLVQMFKQCLKFPLKNY
jgi:hypothetical protein